MGVFHSSYSHHPPPRLSMGGIKQESGSRYMPHATISPVTPIKTSVSHPTRERTARQKSRCERPFHPEQAEATRHPDTRRSRPEGRHSQAPRHVTSRTEPGGCYLPLSSRRQNVVRAQNFSALPRNLTPEEANHSLPHRPGSSARVGPWRNVSECMKAVMEEDERPAVWEEDKTDGRRRINLPPSTGGIITMDHDEPYYSPCSYPPAKTRKDKPEHVGPTPVAPL